MLKLVSLFILWIIKTYYCIINKSINGIIKEYDIYKNDQWYIIPTISFSKTNCYFEVMMYWLCFQYYSSYKIDKDEEEK